MLYRYVAANGIGGGDGKGSTDIATGDLRGKGHRVIDTELVTRSAVTAFWDDAEEDARIIVKLKGVEPGAILFGHSFGGARAVKAAELMYFSAIVLINPAMPRDYDFSNLKQADGYKPTAIYCIHAPGDYVIWSSRPFARLANLLTRNKQHAFGWAGAFGFTSELVQNTAISGWGHSTAFYEHRALTHDLLVTAGRKHYQEFASE